MSKLINVSDEIYKILYSLKGNESFSLAIKKLIETKSNKDFILSCAGKGSFSRERIKDVKKGWNKWSEKYA